MAMEYVEQEQEQELAVQSGDGDILGQGMTSSGMGDGLVGAS